MEIQDLIVPGQAQPSSTASRTMSPVAFGHCFGWLHEGWGDVGVVICPDVGWDTHKAYGSLRALADELARCGYPTLRFDYPGTGNSQDLDGEDICVGWLRSVGAAGDWLRATGVRRLVLCGVHMGALLAGVAATGRDDICALVLLNPVMSGGSYLREIAIAANLASGVPASGEAAREVAGLRLAGPDLPLRELSLLSLPSAPARHVLILNSGASSATAKLADRLHVLGAAVTKASFEPFSEFDGSGRIGRGSDLGMVGSWLRQVAVPVPRPKLEQQAAVGAGIRAGGFVEHPLRFGPAQGLFGVLCRPDRESRPGFVAMIVSQAATPHHGFARFHVRLARRLAAEGIASLRFDFEGIGDSYPDTPAVGTHIYETNRELGVTAAVDALGELGYRHFAVAGLCSGAYHAFRASLAERRIEILVMLNPATFVWDKGQTFSQFQRDNHRSTQFYLAYMARQDGWMRLLRGELDVAKALRAVRKHALRRLVAVGARAAGSVGWSTEADFPRRAMQHLSARGVRILLSMSLADGGLDVLQASFGRGGGRLAKLPGCSVRLLPDVDHSLSRIAMQDEVADVVLDFLQDRQRRNRRGGLFEFVSRRNPHA